MLWQVYRVVFTLVGERFWYFCTVGFVQLVLSPLYLTKYDLFSALSESVELRDD